MTNIRINVTHDHEETVVSYCVKNDIEFNQANAYDVVIETFKEDPIIHTIRDNETGESQQVAVTNRIARQIECQPKMIERIADKVSLAKEKYEKQRISANIVESEKRDKPNLLKLVENLYRLNIVDADSYLALICFLMQLKHTRSHTIQEDDKTCVFFNGVARNGKSATAKAICDVESEYGVVFRAKSGKILESNHEENVWKSHLNYFDEVKPTDIDRELLLTIINGGNVEINPKNKKQYNFFVNTNNIFTSNDLISLKQRRVSVVKFGDRLNGRPLESGTLKEIITNIFESLPAFDRYYDIFSKVSVQNEKRINPLAVEAIITFMTDKLGFVSEGNEHSLTAELIFSAHDIYNCIKGTYNKQIISSERREAIKIVLDELVDKALLNKVEYKTCTTTYFKITALNYLKIMQEYSKINTCDENNTKISKTELTELLLPFFGENRPVDDSEQPLPEVAFDFGSPFSVKNKTIKLIDSFLGHRIFQSNEPYGELPISDTNKKKGTKIYYELLHSLQRIQSYIQHFFDQNPEDITQHIIQHTIDKPMCQYLTFDLLCEVLEQELPVFDDSHKAMLHDVYVRYTGITDPETLKMSEATKVNSVYRGISPKVTLQDYWEFQREKEKKVEEAQKERDNHYLQSISATPELYEETNDNLPDEYDDLPF